MLLLDTSGLFCFIAPNEPHHSLAVRLLEGAGTSVVHSGVLMELVSLLEARGEHRSRTNDFIEMVIDSPEFKVFWLDERDYREALALLRRRQDKTYSLCDAASFILMRRFGIHEALTLDHHFEQEGFVRLLK
jgi:uncharacterized protein